MCRAGEIISFTNLHEFAGMSIIISTASFMPTYIHIKTPTIFQQYKINALKITNIENRNKNHFSVEHSISLIAFS